jgi:hypothetical protein
MHEGAVDPRYGLSGGHGVSGACRLEVENVYGESRVVAAEEGSDQAVSKRLGKGLFAGPVLHTKPINGLTGKRN